ncbi:non-specific lipid-transfer protein 2-like [Andrographis paniculata]|uniref:non-specific lipid-transfer protein 2-like n=1 Tax=Andrographis paniculata TaxID=175694 RepID=UPI0021E7E96E|nr:non-specific lipid-transfer protein 2-like [Andrographis paniculata]
MSMTKKMMGGIRSSRVGVQVLMAVIACVCICVCAAGDDDKVIRCDPMGLGPCLPALSGSGSPTAQCCQELRSQQPCLCRYLRNPAFKPYIDSPNAKAVASTCAVQIPTNC